MEKTIWPISKLKNWDKNPRAIKEKDFQRLKKQIVELGQYKPLVVTSEGEVLGGNMRLRAYKELGISEVWVSIVDSQSEDEKLKYALSDNDRAGYYDAESLANLIPQYSDFNWGDYSVDIGEPLNLKDLIDRYSKVEEDESVDASGIAVSKQGEIYQLGKHRLLCGDSLDSGLLKKLMDGKKAHVIFTDPPYNVDYSYDWKSDFHKCKKIEHRFFSDKRSNEEYGKFLTDVFINGFAYTTEDASFYCWYGIKNHSIVEKAIRDAGWKISQVLIWVKNYPVLSVGQDFHRTYEPCFHGWKNAQAFHSKIGNYRDVLNWEQMDFLFDLWYEKRDALTEYEHPTQKPVGLAERALKKSCPKDGLVLDFFGGSGSTLIAAEQLNRVCYLVELDPLYCDVIRKRYARFIDKEDEWQKVTQVV